MLRVCIVCKLLYKTASEKILHSLFMLFLSFFNFFIDIVSCRKTINFFYHTIYVKLSFEEQTYFQGVSTELQIRRGIGNS